MRTVVTRHCAVAWQWPFSYCQNTRAVVPQKPWNVPHTTLTTSWRLLFVWTPSNALQGHQFVANSDLKEAVRLATWLHTKAWAMLNQCDEQQVNKSKASAIVSSVFSCVNITKYCTLQIHFDLLSQYRTVLTETY
jgi:hypothetical protein